MHKHQIVLASSSSARQQLLTRIITDFTVLNPNIDETAQANEKPQALAIRLALEKAQAVQKQCSRHLIIGSDQVAILNDQQIHKPGNRHNNIKQLQMASGQKMEFYTSICVLNSANHEYICNLEKSTVIFKELSTTQIENYVDKDKAYFCVGGFKVESLGIALFDHLESKDPNALIGLPLIQLVTILQTFGVDII